MLRKISYDSVCWKQEGHLYRADSEGIFALRIIKSLSKDRGKKYYGTKSDGKKITFSTLDLFGAMEYAKYFLGNVSRSVCGMKDYGLSDYPILMDIDAGNYKDELYLSSEGEGVVVGIPVNLQDIEIIYGPYLNKVWDVLTSGFLNEKPEETKSDACFLTENFSSQIEQKAKNLGIEKEDLLGRYAKNPEETKNSIGLIFFGYKFKDSEEQNEKIQEFLSVLREKMR